MKIRCAVFLAILPLLGGCARTQYYPAGQGGTTVNGRECHYNYRDYQIRHIIVFDSNYYFTTGTFGGENLTFQTTGGQTFSMKYGEPGVIIIDGVLYHLKDGVVFLVKLSGEENHCRQVPVRFTRRNSPTPNIEGYVRGELLRVADEHAELTSFLGLEKR